MSVFEVWGFSITPSIKLLIELSLKSRKPLLWKNLVTLNFFDIYKKASTNGKVVPLVDAPLCNKCRISKLPKFQIALEILFWTAPFLILKFYLTPYV